MQASNNIVPAREMWNRMVDNAIVKYEYSGDYDQFLTSMERLGFEKDQVEELVMEDME
tara:strand:+ start:683 stop:856 length:174 start_codon:yes stop_codon:yes gene_type:complete